MNDYQLRMLFGVVEGGINLLRDNADRLTDAQRRKLQAHFIEEKPSIPVRPASTSKGRTASANNDQDADGV